MKPLPHHEDNLMARGEEVDHNALCGLGPAEPLVFFGYINLNLENEDALLNERQQGRKKDGGREGGGE